MTVAELQRLRKRDGEYESLEAELARLRSNSVRLSQLQRENAVLKALFRQHGLSLPTCDSEPEDGI